MYVSEVGKRWNEEEIKKWGELKEQSRGGKR
jgi:hypothetical protein